MTKPTFIDPFDNAESTKPAFVDPFETDAEMFGSGSKPEKSKSPKISDYVKSTLAGAGSGVGMIFQGGGDLLARGLNSASKAVGYDLSKSAMGAEFEAKNPLQPAVDYLNESMSPQAKQAMQDSTPSGELLSPSTWKFGDDPSISGYMLHGANTVGQFVPNAAIGVATGGLSLPAQAAVGATVGGVQAYGGGVADERARFTAMTHDELMGASTDYADLIAKGTTPSVAKTMIADKAGIGGGIGNAIPSSLEGAAENVLIGMLTKGKLSGKVPALFGTGALGKTATGVAGGALIGGAEESIEQATQNIGSNIAVGGNRPIGEDTLNQFVMGAMGEGVVGGIGGAASHYIQPSANIPSNPAHTATPEPTQPPAPEGSLTSAATIAQAVGLTPQPVTPDVTEAKPNIVDSLNAVEAQQNGVMPDTAIAPEQPVAEMPAPTIAPEQAAEKQIIDEQAQQAATSPLNDLPQPTEKQVEAGNYKKGHIKYDGLDITVENPQGSTRSGVDEDNNPWTNTLANHYGYIKRTKGNDGDNLDVFVGDKPANGKVFVINQTKKDGSFDEHKAVLGAETADEAIAIYKANYADDWNGGKSVTELTTPAFKDWLKNGDPTKPLETVSATSNDVDMTKVAVGEQVDVGGVPYVKTENGFERVTSATENVADKTTSVLNKTTDVAAPAANQNDSGHILREIARLSNEVFNGNHPNAPDLSTADGTFAGLGSLNMDDKGNVILHRVARDENHLSKGWKSVKNGAQELIETSLSQAGGQGLPTSGLANWSENYNTNQDSERQVARFTIPANELLDAIRRGDAIIGNVSEGEIVLNPSFAKQYLSQLNGKSITNEANTANVDTTTTLPERVDETANGVQVPAIRKGEVGSMLAAQEVVTTASGRTTTPFPKFNGKDGKVSNFGLKAVDKWLVDNAIAEAESRNDDFNLTQFKAINLKNLSQADKDGAEEYLFGSQPPVVPSILKPLVAENLISSENVNTEISAPVNESVQPTDTVRPLVEQLTKLRATADKHPSFDPALKAAKDFMAGKKVSPKQFKNFANLLGKKNKAFREVLMQLHDQAASTPEQLAAKDKKSKLAKAMLAERMKLDTTKDGLMQAMAKLGGLNADKAKSEFGIDPADMRQHGAGIKRSFNKNGLDADTMRELLLEQGYPVGESVADLGNAIADAMSGIDVLTPAGQEALAQKKYEEYANTIDELSDDEKALLDELVTKATAKYGAEALAEIDASLAESMKGQPQPEIERALLRMLKEEFDDETGNAGNSQATEGQAGQDTESGSTETGGRRAQQDGAEIEGQGSETGEVSARKYTPPASVKEAQDRWKGEYNGTERVKVELDENQTEIMAAVEKAIDAGLFYNKEVVAFVAKELNVTPSELEVGKNEVENGAFGMDVYLAKQEVQKNNLIKANVEQAKKLKLSIGENIGKLKLSDGKIAAASTVTKLDDSFVTLTAKRGSQTISFTTDYLGVTEYAKRADNNYLENKVKLYADLLGDNTAAKQALADAERAKDAQRNSGADNQDTFTLSGSDSEFEQARAAGAQDLIEASKAEQPKPETKTAEKVDDFGEKLEGARKDMARAMAKEYSDDEIASLPLSKLWPLSDVNLIENKMAAALAWAAREEIPSKPRKPYALKTWVAKVKVLRDIGRLVSKALESNPELMLQKIKDANLGHFKSKVALLEAIDRDAWKRIGKVEEYPDAYGYVDGVKQSRPFVRVDIDSRTHSFSASSLADVIDKVNEVLGKEKQAPRMAFEVRGAKGSYFINKTGDKNYTQLKTFDNSKDAFNFINNNYDEVLALWEATKEKFNVKETDVRNKTNRPRTGEDYRKGKDVSTEAFATTFGFRGVQFGEWVKQGGKDNDRQGALNAAYDALLDLANIINVPPKALSLEGTLGLSFGARGSGKAAAHFEPGNLVINLTKTQGAGSLAHEFFHALDNYFSRKRGGEKSMADVGTQQGYRENNYITYKPEPLYIHKNYGGKGITAGELQRMRSQNPTSGYLKAENWIKDPKHPEGVRPEVEQRFADLVEALNTSPMKNRARAIDKVKEGTDGYWSRIIELAARSFENYVIHKMQLNGYDNDYLANVVRVESFNRDSSRFPYLLDEEIAPVAEAFDNLFSTLETKETDKGIALYQNKEEYGNYGITEKQRSELTEPERRAYDQSAATAIALRGVKNSVLGLAVSRDFKQTGSTSLLGKQIATPEDLAVAAQVYRDPRFETVRYFFIKDGSVISQTSVTSKLAGVATLSPNVNGEGVTEFISEIAAEASNLGADGVYLLHNHPDGNPTPSKVDMTATKFIQGILAEKNIDLLGHVIINHQKYAVIDRENNQKVIERKFENTYSNDNPAVPHAILGKVISDQYDLAEHAKAIEFTEGNVVLIGTSGMSGISVITEIEPADLKPLKLAAILRKLSRQSGAESLFAYNVPLNLSNLAAKAIKNSILVDAITTDTYGNKQSLRSFIDPDDNVTMGRPLKGYVVKQTGVNENYPVDTKYSRPSSPTFYSALAKAIPLAKQDTMPAGQWKNWLVANAGKMNVKQAELQWSGLTDWLDLQQGKVSKADIQQYLDANGVQVTETMLGDKWRERIESRMEEINDEVTKIVEEFGIIPDLAGDAKVKYESLEKEFNDLDDRLRSTPEYVDETKYDKYTVAGGENYKELLLTLPENTRERDAAIANLNAYRESMFDKYGVDSMSKLTKVYTAEEDLELDRLLDAKNEADPRHINYISSHFDQPNILAHVRFDERVDADGNKVLFINEIQSDWGQDGKKKGFAVKDIDAERARLREEGNPKWATVAIDNFSKTPQAPFVTKTDAWVSLALKRMIRYAAENGFDKVAIISGKQAGDLYSLAKQVDEIIVEKLPNGTFNIQATLPDGGGTQEIQNDVMGDELEEIIGKDLAKKVINQDYGTEVYDGGDLEVGNEGMKAFYDKIVPQVANDVLKKLGGGKVENVEIDTRKPEDNAYYEEITNEYINNQLGFTITPELRAKALEGLPLFSRQQSKFSQNSNGIDIRDLNAVVANVNQALRGLPQTHVLEDYTKAPAELVADIKRDKAYDAAGAWHNGEIYLFRNNIINTNHALFTMLHESTHEGLRRVFGKEIDATLMGIYLSNKDIKQQADSLRATHKDLSLVASVEEALADMGGNGIKASVMDKLIAFVRNFLRRLGMNLTVSDGEVRTLVTRALDSLKSPSKVTHYTIGSAYSKPTPRLSPVVQPATPNQQWQNPDKSKLDNVIYMLQNKFVDLKRVIQGIQKAGNSIDDKWNPYLQEELYTGRTATRTKDFIKHELEPLMKSMQARKVDMADFEEYLWARHAEERNIQIAKINPAMQDGGSGMTTQDARDYLANLTPVQSANYQALAAKVDAILKTSRQRLISYGLETPETIAAWEGAYQHYVPLMREDMDNGFGNGSGQGFSVKGNASKRATGSKRAVVDVLANIAQQVERNIIRGEKNRVSTALVGLATLNPNKDFWKVDVVPKMRTVVAGKNTYEVLYNGSVVQTFTNPVEANKFIQWNGAGYTLNIVKGQDLVMDVPDPSYKNRDNVVVARIVNAKGKIEEHFVEFNTHDERAMRAAASIKNLDQDQIGELLGTASSITRYFSSINTQYNPFFGVINILRDVQGSLLNLSSTALAGKQMDVLKNTPLALKGIYQDIRSERKTGTPTNSFWSLLFEDFQKQGGQTGYRDMYRNAKERGEALKHALDPTWWQQTTAGKIVTINGILAKPEQFLLEAGQKYIFDWLSDYNESMENAVRLSAYKVALDNGMSKAQAASLAKNISVNFNRKGEMGRQIGSLYAFFNASVQGTARIGETLFTDDNGKLTLSKAGKAIVTGGLLLGVMQALMLAAAGFGDDEPPEFVRDRNLIIPLGNGKAITIAMPLGFNALPAFGRILTEWALSGGEDTSKRFVHIFDMLAEVTNPIGSAGLSMQTLVPTMLDPLAALAENKDWTGRPIAKMDFNSQKPTAGHTRAKDTASAISKGLSWAVNEATGGSDYTPGALSPTPDQIDYLIGQLTGGVGREYMKLEQSATSIVTGEDLPVYKIPLVGRFYLDAEGQSSQSSRFYDNLKSVFETETELKGLRKDGLDTSEYRANHPEAALVFRANLEQREISKMYKLRSEKLKADASPEEIKALNERITARMLRFNELFIARTTAGE